MVSNYRPTSFSSNDSGIVLPSILTTMAFQNLGLAFGNMPPHGTLQFNQTALYHLTPAPQDAPLQMAIRVWHHPTFAASWAVVRVTVALY